ncbi:uncharacterized protein N7443_006386 [Penicillium atrosanguineum]|uniref:uncharacterized protein n=1 Tax=Penicillium atrosanguineum TaxID=1132637 RepID=UPI002387BFC6|nr:uncharacterized protein N7443_006386 [Penicillium atrosanguineum]KAJ5298266.1 hypothetical protein N7443_006386 [Penicillium atrosanguineum]
MPLNAETLANLQILINSACTDTSSKIPGATVAVIGKDGEEIFTHSAGKRGISSAEPMTLDTIFWIASCTKLLTAIACMQLVEQGGLELDNGLQLESLCPELKDLKVLRDDDTLEEKKKAITLRMLLTHTAGFGYTFFNERLRNWSLPIGVDEFSGGIDDIKTPLLFQPGEGWEYGVSLDWAGLAVERVTGLSLNEYLTQHIFQPLEIENMSMIPNEEMREKLAHMHSRAADGTLKPRDHLLRAPLIVDPKDDKETKRIFNSGGAGIFAKPQEYCKILAVLLNDGICPRTGAHILQTKTVQDMFENQIPQFPHFGRQGIPASKPDLTNPIPDIHPIPEGAPQGWGLSFMLSNSQVTGRSTKTAHWAGLANLFWWCDREKGVAGIVCTQILPFADIEVLKLWAGVETEVYRGLKSLS